MAKTVPVRFGDVELLVETVPVAGSEPTSRLTKAVDGVVDVVDDLREAIVGVASSVVAAIEHAAAQAARPDRLEVEFGVKFSAQGNVIVAGLAAESTLRVTLIYDPRPATNASPVQPSPTG